MRTIKTILSPCLLAALAVSASASSKDEQAIRALYAKFKTAMMQKDLSAIESMEAPGFTETEHGQKMTADQANKMMQQQFEMTKSMKRFDMKITDIKVSGKTAHVTSKYSVAGTMGPMGKNDTKNHTFGGTGIMHEELVKTDSGWMFKTVKDGGSKMTMDGKPMKM